MSFRISGTKRQLGGWLDGKIVRYLNLDIELLDVFRQLRSPA